jgi:hypothetical protein
VNEEIRCFKALGKAHRVLAMIVAGEPWASDRPEEAGEAGDDPGPSCHPEPSNRYLKFAVISGTESGPRHVSETHNPLVPGSP